MEQDRDAAKAGAADSQEELAKARNLAEENARESAGELSDVKKERQQAMRDAEDARASSVLKAISLAKRSAQKSCKPTSARFAPLPRVRLRTTTARFRRSAPASRRSFNLRMLSLRRSVADLISISSKRMKRRSCCSVASVSESKRLPR